MNARVALVAWVLLGSCAKSSMDAPARLLVRGATLQLLVASLDGLEAKVARDVEALGGFTTSSELSGTGDGAALSVAFRVPAAKLDEAMHAVEAHAHRVESKQLRGDDFTEAFVDLESQRTNLTATRDRLLALLEKSARVEDALAVNKGLSEVQGELEKLEGRMKYLRQAAALSTVTVTFRPESSVGEWRPVEVARTSARALLAVLQFLGSALIVVLVFSPVWAPLAWVLRRKRVHSRS